MTAENHSPRDIYIDYLQRQGVAVGSDLSSEIETLTSTINWEEPETSVDYHFIAVLALVEAEQTEDLQMRRLYVDMALQSLETAIDLGGPSLAVAQWAICQALLGDLSKASQVAFNQLIASSELAYEPEQLSLQLVYIPSKKHGSSGASTADSLLTLLQAPGLQMQRLHLAAEALCSSHLVLYNPSGEKILQVLADLLPDSASVNLKLGTYRLANQSLEGFLNLHKMYSLTTATSAEQKLCSATALYLAAQTYQSPEKADFWKQQVHLRRLELAKTLPALQETSADDPYVYIPYDLDIYFAAEPTLNSIVTRVLLAEGDWFEQEMEFWRKLIRPGMTVIDVGANSGVYAFSAAKRVGKTGKVIAIEPFQGCVSCLKQTCHVNGFGWVKVCAAAASDRPGKSFLTLHAASELNEISTVVDKTGKSAQEQNVQEIDCITLDSLLEQEHLERVDFLKIDAEGHEVQVLHGAEQLLKKFHPVILYENIAGQSSSNLGMASALEEVGYRLLTYQPWVQQLMPVESVEELQGVLNVIAVSQEHVPDFLAEMF